MKKINRRYLAAKNTALITILVLLSQLSFGFFSSAKAQGPPALPQAQSTTAPGTGSRKKSEFVGRKLAPDLQALVQRSSTSSATVRVIIQTTGRELPPSMAQVLNRNGIHLKKQLHQLGSVVVELPLNIVQELQQTMDSGYISIDRPVEMLGHLEETTGTALVRQTPGTTNLTGANSGLAVLDSGISANNKAFAGAQGSNSRVVASVDFTGQGVTTSDPYGHGTHVSGLGAGQSSASV